MCVKYFIDLVNCKQEELESLQRQLHNSKLHEKECYEARRVLSMGIDHDRVMTRAEAIKRFAERLKEKAFIHERPFEANEDKFIKLVAVDDIDNLVKEMVGDAECWAMSSVYEPHRCYERKDLVEVVRCKDCKYYVDRDGYCWNQQWITHDEETWVQEDAFCSYAERKIDSKNRMC